VLPVHIAGRKLGQAVVAIPWEAASEGIVSVSVPQAVPQHQEILELKLATKNHFENGTASKITPPNEPQPRVAVPREH
jgi:hypothetical protein